MTPSSPIRLAKRTSFRDWLTVPLFLLGFLGNAAALWALFATWNSWTDTCVYMLNLAIADSTLILFLPFRIYNAFFCLSITVMCTFLISIHFINMYASILTTAAISVQHFLTIRFFLQDISWRRKKEIAFVLCLLFWGVLVTICVLFREENHPDKLWTSYERFKNFPLPPEFVFILVFLGYLIPLAIMFCSSRIICQMWTGSQKK